MCLLEIGVGSLEVIEVGSEVPDGTFQVFLAPRSNQLNRGGVWFTPYPLRMSFVCEPSPTVPPAPCQRANDARC